MDLESRQQQEQSSSGLKFFFLEMFGFWGVICVCGVYGFGAVTSREP